jgi:hypothetical protein
MAIPSRFCSLGTGAGEGFVWLLEHRLIVGRFRYSF